jgi:hypothetical protein
LHFLQVQEFVVEDSQLYAVVVFKFVSYGRMVEFRQKFCIFEALVFSAPKSLLEWEPLACALLTHELTDATTDNCIKLLTKTLMTNSRHKRPRISRPELASAADHHIPTRVKSINRTSNQDAEAAHQSQSEEEKDEFGGWCTSSAVTYRIVSLRS